MNPPNRDETIFHAIIQQREAHLAEACAGDQVLRARVEKLLEAHARSENFFNKEALQIASGEEVPTIVAESDAPGTVIGRYKPREKIGEGGCGIVMSPTRRNRCVGGWRSRSSNSAWTPPAGIREGVQHSGSGGGG